MSSRKQIQQPKQLEHSVYGKKCVNERTCRRWFVKFRSRDFTLEYKYKTVHSVEIDDKLLEENHALSFEDLAIKLEFKP